MNVGDPGFLSFLGGLGRSLVSGITGLPTAQKTGAAGIASITGMLGTVLGRVVSKPPGGAVANVAAAAEQAGGSAIVKVLKKGAPAAAGVAAGLAAGGMGGAAAALMGGGGRRRRRMHVTNVKALRRSIRRCQGFTKLAKRVLRFTSPKPVRGRAVFKARRRKK